MRLKTHTVTNSKKSFHSRECKAIKDSAKNTPSYIMEKQNKNPKQTNKKKKKGSNCQSIRPKEQKKSHLDKHFRKLLNWGHSGRYS